MTTTQTPQTNTLYDAVPNTTAIVDVFAHASVEDIEAGMSWYSDAHALAVALSPDNVNRGAGVIAALSPMLAWERNMMLAARAFEDGYASGCLARSCAKADRILAGESPESVLSGNKVVNFYRCIADPQGHGVCIDRHSFDVAVGSVTNDRSRGQLSRKGVYKLFTDAYISAAEYVTANGFPISPSQLQAVTWVAWRRIKGA